MIIFVIIDGIKTEMAPNLALFKWMAKRGSFTLKSRPAYPPLTEPCFAAIFYSMDPVHLGCYWMGSKRWGKYPDYPRGVVDLFTAAKQAGCKSTVVGTWPELGQVVDLRKSEDCTRRSRTLDSGVTAEAIAKIAERKTDLLIVYYEDPDHVGHEVGIGKKYQESLENAQRQVVEIIKHLDPAKDTLIVTSDHSRDKKEHAWFLETIMQTPLFFWGRKIRQRNPIKVFVSSIDIAPTIMKLLGAPIPAVWRGRVIDEIFT
jgi:hypothetical protein